MRQLKAIQELPISIEEAWDFFSSPKNLGVITPKSLDFQIKSALPKTMYPGLFIEYTVKPMLGIPMTWVTEITYIKNLEYFVDEQRVGPYTIWHHEHFFKKINGGTEMTDLINYQVPMGAIGEIFEPFLVRPKLTDIFDFRRKKMIELFGTMEKPNKKSVPA